MDFTLTKYGELMHAFAMKGYVFRRCCEYPFHGKGVCLRHDVDKRPENALEMAKLEHGMGICATYYFRMMPMSWDVGIVKQIAAMGHEVGYHYETLTTCGGDVDAAYEEFQKNLTTMRAVVPVETICMHGSPRTHYDNRDMWKKYDYRRLDISYEPYLDTDWSDMFYLTDTGRCWNGWRMSIRDKIPFWQDRWEEQGLVFECSADIIREMERIPDRVMLTTHPQRWTDNRTMWVRELLWQRVKNVVKKHKNKMI